MKPSPIAATGKTGIVIGTHAAVPYVHLGLECLRRNEPDVRVLIHDDSSHDQDRLRALASEYGASFYSTPGRRVPTVGDLSAFAEGLRWANTEGLDIVVKCSRRYIINKPWSVGLRELMHNTQYCTATAPCSHFGFGFRSELVAMHVPSWIDSGAMGVMASVVENNMPYDPLPEAYDHWRARDVHSWAHPTDWNIKNCLGPDGQLDANHPNYDYLVSSNQMYSTGNYDGYAWWTAVMGLSRMQTMPGILWHDSHQPVHYAALSQELGLPYTVEDFQIIPGQ